MSQKDKSMNKQYVEQREDVYWVAGTRVSLDSIVYAFLEGQTAESIAQSFPVLTLEQVYGAITFYISRTAPILMPIYVARRQSLKPCARPGVRKTRCFIRKWRRSTPEADNRTKYGEQV